MNDALCQTRCFDEDTSIFKIFFFVLIMGVAFLLINSVEKLGTTSLIIAFMSIIFLVEYLIGFGFAMQISLLSFFGISVLIFMGLIYIFILGYDFVSLSETSAMEFVIGFFIPAIPLISGFISGIFCKKWDLKIQERRLKL